MNVILYGGSFDPIHTGHALLASAVSQQCTWADEVWLNLTPQNPLKHTAAGATDAQRRHMVQSVCKTLRHVKVCDIEFTLPRPCYTHTTLEVLKAKYPSHSFRLMIGSDNWPIFDRWHRWQNIIDDFGVFIYERPGFAVDRQSLPTNVTLLEGMPVSDISSTLVRRWIDEGKDVRYMVPDAVYSYITENKIYAKRHIAEG